MPSSHPGLSRSVVHPWKTRCVAMLRNCRWGEMGSELPSGHGMEFDADSFVKTPLTLWNSKVVPVVVIDPQRRLKNSSILQCVGTAFNISPEGVWVTARHVINWAIELVAERPGAYIAVLWVGSGVGEDVPDLLGGQVPVVFISKDDGNGSDLALLRAGKLKDGKPYLFPTCPLSARIPKRGTKILGQGYALVRGSI